MERPRETRLDYLSIVRTILLAGETYSGTHEYRAVTIYFKLADQAILAETAKYATRTQ